MDQIELPDPQGAREFFARKVRYTTGPVELNQQLEAGQDLVVVDVRDAEDFDKGHIPGSINLPRSQWNSYSGLRKEVPNAVVCYSHVCHLAAKAALVFATAGFPVLEMDGGFEAWKENGLEIEKGSSHTPRQTALRH